VVRRLDMKLVYRLGFAIALLCVVPETAGATDLRLVGSDSEMEIYLDRDSLRSVPGTSTELGYKDVFVTTLYARPQVVNNLRVQATRARMLFRCMTVEGSLELLHFYASRDLRGEPVARFDYPTNWQRVDPQTDVGLVWKYVCTHI
jgi:hypothetical protein